MDQFKVDQIEEDLGKAGTEEDEFWPLSGEPYFSVILAKSHVKTLYHLGHVSLHCDLRVTDSFIGNSRSCNRRHVACIRPSQTPQCRANLPMKIFTTPPSDSCPTVLKYRGMKWDMTCVTYGRDRDRERDRKCYAKWKNFVIDNDLNIGDACVFELSNFSDTLIEFKVQILRGDFPVELEKGEGSADTPIVID